MIRGKQIRLREFSRTIIQLHQSTSIAGKIVTHVLKQKIGHALFRFTE